MSEIAAHYRVLFVCLGNICRSPAAEAIMNTLITRHGLEGQISIDSAGTERYNIGNPSDSRMRAAGMRRKHVFNHRARQMTSADFDRFDLILVMDHSNLRDVRNLARTAADESKVALFLDYCAVCANGEVPDPYYGGAQGFEDVLDMLEQGCTNLVKQISDSLKTRASS